MKHALRAARLVLIDTATAFCESVVEQLIAGRDRIDPLPSPAGPRMPVLAVVSDRDASMSRHPSSGPRA